MIQRIASMLRWAAVPWSHLAVAAALVGAAAAPAILVTASDIWRAAVNDDFTRRTVASMDADELGVSIETNALMRAEAASDADEIIAERLRAIPGLAEPLTTTWTGRERAQLGDDLVTPPIPVRALARTGALDAIEVIDSDPTITDGVWVSSYLADLTGAGVGDQVVFDSALQPEEPSAEVTPSGGPRATWRIAGIYEPLWSPEGATLDPYWQDVPADLRPLYLAAFNGPSFSLLLLDEGTMRSSGLTGFMQWEARSEDTPETLAELEARVGDYRTLESALVNDATVAGALADLASFRPATPQLTSGTYEALADIRAASARLAQPLASARTGGVAVGLAVVIAGALFAVQRRRIEYRLLAGEGERWLATGIRSVFQLAAPVAIGTIVGVLVGAFAASWLGPADSLRLDAVQWLDVAMVAAVGLVLAALATGLAAQRTLDTGTLGADNTGATSVVLAILIAATAFLWYQAATIPSNGDETVDLTVISLPLVALVTGIAIVVALLGVAVRLGRHSGGRLPTPLFLAWRRITRNDTANALIIGSVGVGVGLVTLSFMLVAALDRVGEVKLATTVGAETAIELVSLPEPDEMPPESVIVSFDPVRFAPGGGQGRVVAIGSTGYSSVVEWPPEFGSSAEEVVALVQDSEVGDSVPAVVVAGSGLPRTGTFGVQRIPYTIVGEVRSAPLATPFGATLLVSAERVDEYAVGRLADMLGVGPDDPQLTAAVPTKGYRHVLVSRLGEEELQAWLEDGVRRSRSMISRSSFLETIDVLAPRIAFDYLRVLGIVAAVAAVAAVVLHLAAQRKRRTVAAAMTRRMGLSSRTAAAATAWEVMAMAGLAVATGVAVAVLVSNRLLPRFDPAPEVPPAPIITVSVIELATWSLVIMAMVAVGVWIIDWVAARRSRGGVNHAE
jgi:putative ABC transport system permease protein